jgi:hypothetical protein
VVLIMRCARTIVDTRRPAAVTLLRPRLTSTITEKVGEPLRRRYCYNLWGSLFSRGRVVRAAAMRAMAVLELVPGVAGTIKKLQNRYFWNA